MQGDCWTQSKLHKIILEIKIGTIHQKFNSQSAMQELSPVRSSIRSPSSVWDHGYWNKQDLKDCLLCSFLSTNLKVYTYGFAIWVHKNDLFLKWVHSQSHLFPPIIYGILANVSNLYGSSCLIKHTGVKEVLMCSTHERLETSRDVL